MLRVLPLPLVTKATRFVTVAYCELDQSGFLCATPFLVMFPFYWAV